MDIRKMFSNRKKHIIIFTSALVLLFLVVGFSWFLVKNYSKTIKPDQAKLTAEKFINDNLLPSNIKATVNKVILEGDVYSIDLDVQGQNYTSYMTKDGKKFFQSGIDMEKMAEETAAKASGGDQAASQPVVQAASQEITKSDKPKVELFVMTHCPYGLQAEKGILPALEALGNKIEAKIRFVHYFMHGDKEEQETYKQLCLRQEQPAKFNSYLKCFAISGDADQCAAQAGVDKAKMNSCTVNKAKEYYQVDSALSQGYGVQGSPTLVINGAQSSAGRDAASYLAGICAAFNNKPAECSKQMSSSSPVAGFGEGSDSSGSSAAGCGQ